MTLSVDLAATIAAVAGLVTVIGNLALQIMQVMQLRKSAENGRKLDVNTQLTKEVHESTTAIAEATGTHQILKPPADP